jgi:hypothetical protein
MVSASARIGNSIRCHVADNGSQDGSQALAVSMGVRIVHVQAKEYGNALMGGIDAARGKYAIMLRIAEVPATLFPDGHRRLPHLRRWRDGWRHHTHCAPGARMLLVY